LLSADGDGFNLFVQKKWVDDAYFVSFVAQWERKVRNFVYHLYLHMGCHLPTWFRFILRSTRWQFISSVMTTWGQLGPQADFGARIWLKHTKKLLRIAHKVLRYRLFCCSRNVKICSYESVQNIMIAEY